MAPTLTLNYSRLFDKAFKTLNITIITEWNLFIIGGYCPGNGFATTALNSKAPEIGGGSKIFK